MNLLKFFLSLFVLISFFISSSLSQERVYDKKTVIVSVYDKEKLEKDYNIKKFLFDVGDSYIYSVYVSEGKTIEEFIKELNSKDYVEFAEPNYIYHLNVVPDDEYVSYQWNLDKIQAYDAWDITTGSDDVVVGIIDTGVDYTHPDLKDNLWKNPDEICNNGIDDDSNGYIDDCYGWDAYREIGDDYRSDHGTHVAGIIAAVGNNGLGVAGLGWNVKVLSCNASDLYGNGLPMEDIADCFSYILKQKFFKGVNVVAVNGSFGSSTYSKAAEKFIKLLDEFGLIFVVSAGNESTDTDSNPSYPCAYRSDNIICVGATDENDKMAYYSNYGFSTVHISAPGSRILSTVRMSRYSSALNTYGYEKFSGTSMASPHVAAAVALLKSVEPDLSPAQIKMRILSTADNISPLYGRNKVCGRLNLYNMLMDISPPKFCMNLSMNDEYIFDTYGKEGFTVKTGVIRNTGKGQFIVNSVALTDPQYFHILEDECTGKSLEFLEECRLKIAYTHPLTHRGSLNEDIKTDLIINSSVGDFTFKLRGKINYRFDLGSALEVSKRNVFFKNVSIGDSKESVIKIKNIYEDDIRLKIRSASNPNFRVETTSLDNPCKNSEVLREKEYCYIKIIYNPQEEGTHYFMVSLTAENTEDKNTYREQIVETQNINIIGSTERTPDIQVIPDTEIIKVLKDKKGNIKKIITIRNQGTIPLTIHKIEFVSGVAGISLDKNAGNNPCGDSIVLSPNQKCTVGILFYGNDKKQNYSTFLRIYSNDKLEKNKFLYIKGIIDKPDIDIEPSKVKFGSLMIGKEKETVIRIYNNSEDYPISITGINLSNKTDFSLDTFGGDRPCGAVPFDIQEADYCTISVTFKPQTTGKKKAVLMVSSGSRSEDISLEGNGIEPIYPQLVVEPEEYDFGNIVVGNSESKVFEVKNEGFTDLTISEIKFKGKEFSLNLSGGNNPCGNTPVTLQPGSICTFEVTFTPQKDKDSKASIEIKSNDPSSKGFKIQLYGKGRYQSPVISVSPDRYDFGVVLIGTYKEKGFTVENTGEKQLRIEQIKLKGKSFSIVNNGCTAPISIAPGDSCSFTVRFTPGKDKREKASVEIKSNDPENKKIKIVLTGEGRYESSILSVTPDKNVIDFGKVKIGESVEKIIKFSNKGNISLHIYEMKFKAKNNFSLNKNGGDKPCGKLRDITLTAKDYCTVSVTFTPDEVDEFKSMLELKTDDPNNKKLKVELIGFGRPYPAPAISLSTRSINLRISNDNICSILGDIVVRNDGEETLKFSIKREKKEEISYSTTCYGFFSYLLDPGESCYISIKLSNCYKDKRRYINKTLKSKLFITDTNDPSETDIEIPINIEFYDSKELNKKSNVEIYKSSFPTEAFVYVGEVSYPYVFEIKNRSDGIVKVKDVYLTNNSDFILDFDAKRSFSSHLNNVYSCKSKQFELYPDEFCYIYVFFAPKSEGLKKTDIVVEEENGEKATYNLYSSAIKSDKKYVFIDPEVFDEFPFVLPNQESDIMEIKIRNIYEIPVQIDKIVLNNDTENSFEIFPQSGDKPCGTLLEIQPDDYCTIGVKFKPVSLGVKRAKLRVVFKDSPVNSVESEIVGRSVDTVEPHIVVTPRQIVTGLMYPKTVSDAYRITIKNTGTDTLNVSDIYPTESDITLINLNYGEKPCGRKSFSLAPYDYCTIGVIFSPQDRMDDMSSINIVSDDSVFPSLKIYIYSDPDERFTLRVGGRGCSIGYVSTLPIWLLSILVVITFRRMKGK